MGYRQTNSIFSPSSLSLSLCSFAFDHFFSPIPTNFLQRSYVSLSNAAVFMLPRVTTRYVRHHVKITFDLLQSGERKRPERAALNVLVRDSLRGGRVSFRGAAGERAPLPRTGGQLIRLAERFITTLRLSGCQFRSCDGSNVVSRAVGVAACVFALATCPLRSRDTRTDRTYGAFGRVIWLEIIPLQIKFRQSYLWKCH